jgi:hypothetical protein
MAALQDIVGSVLQGLTEARASADDHAATIAEKYRNHPVLQHFGVPSFDIQDIEIQLRFAVASIENGVIDAIVTHEALQKIDEKSISALKFKANVQNKIWASSLDADGKMQSQLLAE